MTRGELKTCIFRHFLCGCGKPELALEALHSVLRALGTPHEHRDSSFLKGYGNEGLLYLLLYHLDERGFLEHGGSVSAGWLAASGEELLAALDKHGGDLLPE